MRIFYESQYFKTFKKIKDNIGQHKSLNPKQICKSTIGQYIIHY